MPVVRKLDAITVDVHEDDDGNITFQGAVFVYSRTYEEDGKVEELQPETIIGKPEDAIRVLGASAGKHVVKLAEVEELLQSEREAWKAEKEELEKRLDEAEKAKLQLEAELNALTGVLGQVKTLLP